MIIMIIVHLCHFISIIIIMMIIVIIIHYMRAAVVTLASNEGNYPKN